MGGDADPGPRHVLVVEDDPMVRDALSLALEFSGYLVSTAASMAGAVEQARGDPSITTLIVDYNLPHGERGTEVIRAVRAIRGDGIGALLLSGDTSNAAAEAARTHGLKLIAKPVSLEELRRLLRGLEDARGAA